MNLKSLAWGGSRLLCRMLPITPGSVCALEGGPLSEARWKYPDLEQTNRRLEGVHTERPDPQKDWSCAFTSQAHRILLIFAWVCQEGASRGISSSVILEEVMWNPLSFDIGFAAKGQLSPS